MHRINDSNPVFSVLNQKKSCHMEKGGVSTPTSTIHRKVPSQQDTKNDKPIYQRQASPVTQILSPLINTIKDSFIHIGTNVINNTVKLPLRICKNPDGIVSYYTAVALWFFNQGVRFVNGDDSMLATEIIYNSTMWKHIVYTPEGEPKVTLLKPRNVESSKEICEGYREVPLMMDAGGRQTDGQILVDKRFLENPGATYLATEVPEYLQKEIATRVGEEMIKEAHDTYNNHKYPGYKASGGEATSPIQVRKGGCNKESDNSLREVYSTYPEAGSPQSEDTVSFNFFTVNKKTKEINQRSDHLCSNKNHKSAASIYVGDQTARITIPQGDYRTDKNYANAIDSMNVRFKGSYASSGNEVLNTKCGEYYERVRKKQSVIKEYRENGTFTCGDGTVLNKSDGNPVCNGISDCVHGGDEFCRDIKDLNAVGQIDSKLDQYEKTGEYHCLTGDVLLKVRDGYNVCDGNKDCYDGSEEVCTTPRQYAQAGRQICDGRNIELSHPCPTTRDPSNILISTGRDTTTDKPTTQPTTQTIQSTTEQQYTTAALLPETRPHEKSTIPVNNFAAVRGYDEKRQFLCEDKAGTVLHKRDGNPLCDGKQDCLNGADEKNCNTNADYAAVGRISPDVWTSLRKFRKTGDYPCLNGEILPNAAGQLCDGVPDCSDKTDEYCARPAHFRNAGRFYCGGGENIASEEVCDGKPDCNNQRDEQHCPTSQTPFLEIAALPDTTVIKSGIQVPDQVTSTGSSLPLDPDFTKEFNTDTNLSEEGDTGTGIAVYKPFQQQKLIQKSSHKEEAENMSPQLQKQGNTWTSWSATIGYVCLGVSALCTMVAVTATVACYVKKSSLFSKKEPQNPETTVPNKCSFVIAKTISNSPAPSAV
ncbi:hypothetical protein [Endozoicomonas sp.]|uniref:hypothetical protein n=1 Tax=Endozoicomonas sp. TaxID=1892382 RepID=UPI002883C976|nr:hypothetical protein [Endozoicomonas sp.]